MRLTLWAQLNKKIHLTRELAGDLLVHGDCVAVNAVLTSSSSLFSRLAPEQGAGPDTIIITIKQSLLALITAQVSTALSFLNNILTKL